MIEADLHTHSLRSDGIYPPARLVGMSVAAGLKAIALTDHDTLDGLEEAVAAAPPGFEVISGVELSSSYRGREVHLLAYFIDHRDPGVRQFLGPMRRERRLRAQRIVERLNRAGVPVTFEEVLEIAGARGDGDVDTSIGRPHIADAIVRHGAARDIDDAFIRYLRRGQPGYVPRSSLAAAEAVSFVHAHGGAIVVAHPALNLGESDTAALAREGLDGIEVEHPKQAPAERARLRDLVARLSLVASGGSDYHGPGRNRHEIAEAGVGLSTVEDLRRRARSHRES